MEDDETARTPQERLRPDVQTINVTRNPTPFLPSEREEQTRRDGAGAEDAIYDVGAGARRALPTTAPMNKAIKGSRL